MKWLAAAAAILMPGPAVAALSIDPPSISNTFKGAVTLTITGIGNPGQRVIVEKFLDVDNNNALSAGDLMVHYFKVTDGEVTNLAGRRNLNVPGDDDGNASAIRTTLYYSPEETVGRLDGRFIFRVSPDGVGFAPFTASFTVTQESHGGSGINGRVMAGTTPQPGAIVLIAAGASDDFDVVGITKTDAAGNYSLELPAGVYRPVAVKNGFVFNIGNAPLVTVNAGAMAASPDAVLTTSGRTISGAAREAAAPNPGLPGLLVFGQSQTGMFSLTFTDALGNYTLPAAAGACEVGLLELPLALLGMMHREGFEESSAGNVTGFNLDMQRPTALIYGTVRTPAGTAVPYIDLNGESSGDPEWRANAVTDANGNYTLAVDVGSWRVEAEPSGYLLRSEDVTVNTAGSTVEHNISAYPVTAHLRGRVKDNHNVPVGNVELIAHDFQGTNAWAFTDSNGYFDLGVYGGPGGATKQWSIQLNQGDDQTDYVSISDSYQVRDGENHENINYVVYLVTAHLRGHVLDENSLPVGHINVYASGQSNGLLTGSDVESDGSFDIPVLGGVWRIGMSNDSGSGLLAQDNLQVTVADNVDQSGLVFRVHHTTGTFSGTVKNSQSTGLNGVGVSANINVAGATFSSFSTTGSGGDYSMPVFSGTWQVNASGADLQTQGYQPTPAQNVFINSGNVPVNFVASTGGSTYPGWQSTKFTPAESTDPNQGGPNADFDKDGIVNLMEYALNLEPKIRDASGLPAAGYQPPVGPAAAFLTLTFRRLVGSSGLTYNVQESTGLNQTWTGVTATYEVLPGGDGVTEIVRAKTPVGPGKKFLRLQVVQTGP